MKVTLINHTQHAKELLIFTKQTRKIADPGALDKIRQMTEEEKDAELAYVFKTIGSSWEFVDYTFLIQDVTRAFTHQLVRHRVGTAFAQQAQRLVDMSDFDYVATGDADCAAYHATMINIKKGYSMMVGAGIPIQDARGVLPTNITTNILFKANLRTLNSIMNTRMCVRSQGEMQEVATAMRTAVLEVHPFVEPLMLPFCLEWGRCKFPRMLEECPVALSSPGLFEVPRHLMEKAKAVWQRLAGRFNPQP